MGADDQGGALDARVRNHAASNSTATASHRKSSAGRDVNAPTAATRRHTSANGARRATCCCPATRLHLNPSSTRATASHTSAAASARRRPAQRTTASATRRVWLAGVTASAKDAATHWSIARSPISSRSSVCNIRSSRRGSTPLSSHNPWAQCLRHWRLLGGHNRSFPTGVGTALAAPAALDRMDPTIPLRNHRRCPRNRRRNHNRYPTPCRLILELSPMRHIKCIERAQQRAGLSRCGAAAQPRFRMKRCRRSASSLRRDIPLVITIDFGPCCKATRSQLLRGA